MNAVREVLRIFENVANRVLSLIEFILMYFLGKLIGISIVVRYLRNPNPLTTVSILRCFGAKIGAGTTIKRTIYIDNSYEDENSAGDFSHIKIGNNCYIGDCVYFDLADEIIIENNVVVSGHVSFITHADCHRSKFLEQIFPRICKPIKVSDGAWIGFGSTMLAGVTIGHNSVVAAESLVRCDTEPKTIYAGSPAVNIRNIY